ncbi:MAG: alpha/beta fold hydrolase [Bdellovibrionales bacterium]|nr:alpha/beta fold hydrolase [Bdellovibrionales bacterium]
MSKSSAFIALHGFGGSPEIFYKLAENLKLRKAIDEIWIPDLFKDLWSINTSTVQQWVDSFLEEAKIRKFQKPWIVGYSMGARLALNALISSPQSFEGAILISGAPGIWDKDAIKERENFENLWSERFSSLEYEEYNTLWQKQEIFSSTKSKNLRNDVSGQILAQAMISWSTCRHVFSKNQLLDCSAKIIWLAGEDDKKYVKILSDLMKERGPGELKLISGAGHRLLEDNPKQVENIIFDFIKVSRDFKKELG